MKVLLARSEYQRDQATALAAGATQAVCVVTSSSSLGLHQICHFHFSQLLECFANQNQVTLALNLNRVAASNNTKPHQTPPKSQLGVAYTWPSALAVAQICQLLW
jgi:hypothetical protein